MPGTVLSHLTGTSPGCQPRCLIAQTHHGVCVLSASCSCILGSTALLFCLPVGISCSQTSKKSWRWLQFQGHFMDLGFGCLQYRRNGRTSFQHLPCYLSSTQPLPKTKTVWVDHHFSRIWLVERNPASLFVQDSIVLLNWTCPEWSSWVVGRRGRLMLCAQLKAGVSLWMDWLASLSAGSKEYLCKIML